MRPSLEAQQAGFASALIDPETTAGIATQMFAADARAAARIALYRANLEAAAQRALTNAFPVVCLLVGADCFRALVRSYARAHPSSSGDLNRFGADLPAFVRHWEAVATLAYLGDVAALEWAVHRARYAADARCPSRQRIAALGASDLLAARFAVHPACAWIESRFPIVTIWRAHQPRGAALPGTLDQAETALVVRPLWEADVLGSASGEIAALACLRGGNDMEAAIAAGLDADPKFDFPRALVRWLDNAVLVEADAAHRVAVDQGKD